MKFRKKDKGWEKMKSRLKMNKHTLLTGWGDGQRYGSLNDNLPMAQVAQWVEEGVTGGGKNIPPRPAIRVNFAASVMNDKNIINRARKKINEVALGKITWRQAHESFGTYMVDKMFNIIFKYNDIPNSPKTVLAKGFNNPWVETGILIDSITYKITLRKG